MNKASLGLLTIVSFMVIVQQTDNVKFRTKIRTYYHNFLATEVFMFTKDDNIKVPCNSLNTFVCEINP